MIDVFLDELARGPRALVFAGTAGIGKTILWEAGTRAARDRHAQVLTCRGVEAEASMSFAGLSELLGPVGAETFALLAAPRQRALRVALLLEQSDGSALESHAIGLAVLDLFGVLCRQGPVVVAVDDMQWLDAASAAVVHVALRRLRDTPVGMLATVRESTERTVAIELEHCFVEGRLKRWSVGPLSLAALHHLVRDRVGLELPRSELVRLQAVTRGNPYFALEVGKELVRLGRHLAPDEPLPVPDGLAELLGVRLARLSTSTRDVLLTAALAARPTTGVLSRVFGDQRRMQIALDEAVASGVVVLTDGQVRFAHPLLASVIYEQTARPQRMARHRVLAGAAGDVEEAARHRALGTDGPDAAVSSELAAAAEHAARRGATAAGAELCELAAELTPGDPALARRRRLRAASLHRLAGDGERSMSLLEQLLEEAPPGVERAEVLVEMSWPFSAEPRRWIATLTEAFNEAGADEALATLILSYRGAVYCSVDIRAGLVDARAALERAERLDDPTLLARTITLASIAEWSAATITPGLLERGVELERSLGIAFDWSESPRWQWAFQLMHNGQFEQSRSVLAELHTASAIQGDEATRVMVLNLLFDIEALAGRWSLAQEYAEEATRLAEQNYSAFARLWTSNAKAGFDADLGLVEQARQTLHKSLAISQLASNELFTITCMGNLGRIELALGNLEAAAGYLGELPARLLAMGMRSPTFGVWTDAIETLISIGELERAADYLSQYEETARSPTSLAFARARRCRILLEAQRGDLDAALALIESSRFAIDGLVYPFERGRTMLAIGSVLRQAQQKSAARHALEQALSTFEELGARIWATKARSELRRISGRRPASEALTETELQVANLAAQGRSNREIASALFMGVSTVEAHLSRVYRKLGARRIELSDRLATTAADAANRVGDTAQT